MTLHSPHPAHPPSPSHRGGRRAKIKRWLRVGILSGIGLLVLLAAAGTITYFSLKRDLPSVEQILHRQVAQSTKIYDRTGKVPLYEISGGERRTVVPLTDIPRYLRDATVAVEDENFYREPAFDWKAIVRSFLANLRHGKVVQGGSTITQQLAKNAFLSPEQTITRKIKELILATDLNEHYSKEQILELYLNEIPYGPTSYGVEAASQTFFNKPVKELTLAEAAVLASLPKAPTYYSPWGSHRAELMARQQFVLKKLKSLGKITDAEYRVAQKEQVLFVAQGQSIKAPHFVMLVQDYLTQKYGEDLVRRGGLRVTTTLDWDLQTLAEEAVRTGADRNASLYGGKNAALVAEDPKTGQILALVGSRDYFDTENEGNFNVATQGLRQPGSALKPFVYLTAFEKGYTPDTVIFDTPTEFAANNPECPPTPVYSEGTTNAEGVSGCFHPHNFEGSFRGPMSFRTALATSRNIPAVKVLYLAGPNDVIANVRRMGLSTLTNSGTYGLSLVLGGGAIHLTDLVGAYATLAHDGVHHAQSYVLEVRDTTGSVLESYYNVSEQTVEPQYVRLVNDVLSDVEARRGLFAATTIPYTTLPDRDVAIKTGTSNDFRDAWTFGYTPSLTVGVWAGNNDNAPMRRNGSSIFAAVPIWHEFFAGAHAKKDFPAEAFIRPEPNTPSKPILAGDYLATNEIHSILYSVNRADPTGPPPANPEGDPQFLNWETGVLTWAAENLALTVPALGNVTHITIESPLNGDTLQGNTLSLRGSLASPRGADELRIRVNGQMLEDLRGTFPSQGIYPFSRTLTLFNPQAQNLLEVEAFFQGASLAKTQVIFYHQ